MNYENQIMKITYNSKIAKKKTRKKGIKGKQNVRKNLFLGPLQVGVTGLSQYLP